MSIEAFLAALASRTPSPGGGASACLAGALAAAQAEMVVAYSLGKKDLQEHQASLESARRSLEGTRRLLVELGDEDAQAYEAMSVLGRNDPAREAALERCLNLPRAALAACTNLMGLLEELPPRTSRHLRSDLGIAGVLGEAAARACAWNVRINLAALPRSRPEVEDEVSRALERCARQLARVEQACAV